MRKTEEGKEGQERWRVTESDRKVKGKGERWLKEEMRRDEERHGLKT